MRLDLSLEISHAPVWVFCPASEQFRRDTPEPDFPNASRDGGIACAWVAEQVLNGGKHASEYIGTMGPKSIVITDDMVLDIVTPYIAYVKQLFGASRTINGNPPHVEYATKVTALSWGPVAKPDIWWLDLNTGLCHILDLKSGRTTVEAIGNWQLAGYCVAIIDIVRDLCQRNGVEFKGFQCEMFQPLRSGHSAPWFVAPFHVPALLEQLERKGQEASRPNPPQCSGAHCLKCPGRHDCATARKHVDELLNYTETYCPDNLDPAGLEFEYAMLKRGVSMMKARLSGVEANLKAAARAGTSPNFTLEQTVGAPQWNCAPEIIIETMSSLGLNVAKPVAVDTPTQATKKGYPKAIIDAMSSPGKSGLKLISKIEKENKLKEYFL